MIRYAVSNGNFSNVSTWDGGTTLPGSGDDVYANGFTVTIDQDITVAKISTEVCPTTSIGGGGFASSTTRIVTANIIAGESTCYIYTGQLLVIGNIYGSSTTNGRIALYNNNTSSASNAHTFWVIGNIYGGATTNSYALGMRGDRNYGLNLVGNIYGGDGAIGMAVGYTHIGILVIGNVYAGNFPAIYTGAQLSLPSSIVEITGNVYASGFSNALLGAVSTLGSSAPLVILNGSYFNHTGWQAIICQKLKVNPTSSTVIGLQDDDDVDYNVYTADVLENPPTESDVRSGVVYGIGDAYEGTLAVPPAASVVKDVPVDNTVGTWQFDEPLVNRLKNCATTAMVGQIVASYNAAPVEIIPNAEKRHDYTGTTSFCGTAVQGTLESSPTWNLTKIIVSENGTSTTTVAVNSWENRYIASYS